jgi:hypothetical protein
VFQVHSTSQALSQTPTWHTAQHAAVMQKLAAVVVTTSLACCGPEKRQSSSQDDLPQVPLERHSRSVMALALWRINTDSCAASTAGVSPRAAVCSAATAAAASGVPMMGRALRGCVPVTCFEGWCNGGTAPGQVGGLSLLLLLHMAALLHTARLWEGHSCCQGWWC